MGNVNSQGLTWLEWRNAAGYTDANFSGHDGGVLFSILRDDWRAGVDPALHVMVKADEKAEIPCDSACPYGGLGPDCISEE